MYASVNRVDAVSALAHFLGRAEGQSQHCSDGAARAPDVVERSAGKAAVLSDTGRHERVGQLQQDGTPPTQEHDDLAIDSPRGCTRMTQGSPSSLNRIAACSSRRELQGHRHPLRRRLRGD